MVVSRVTQVHNIFRSRGQFGENKRMENPYLAAKESFTFQRRSKKMLLHQRANPADRKTKTTGENKYACNDLSV